MFACIFFVEDSSLSVVSRYDKDLRITGEFNLGENVQMAWTIKTGKPKKIYNGSIIRINENKEYLARFAAHADKEIKGVKCQSVEENINILLKLSFSDVSGLGLGEKRPRVLTNRLKESQEQDSEISPKKKKKTVEKPVEVENPVEAEDKVIQKKTSDSDKNLELAVTVNKKKANVHKLKKKSPEKQTPAALKTSKKNSEAGTAVDTGRLISNLLDQFPSSSCTVSQSEAVPLTKTWNVCQAALNINKAIGESVDDDSACQKTTDNKGDSNEVRVKTASNDASASQIPVPSASVLAALKAFIRPDVQSFLRTVVDHFEGQRDHQEETNCFQDSSYSYWEDDSSFLDQLHDDQPETSYCNLSNMGPINKVKETPQQPVLRRSPRKVPVKSLTNRTNSWDVIHSPAPTNLQNSAVTQSPPQANINSTFTQSQPFAYVNSANMGQNNRSNNSDQTSVVVSQSPRPAMGLSNNDQPALDINQSSPPKSMNSATRVKLLESRDVWVTSDGIRRATSATKKHEGVKKGKTLMYKIVGEVFSAQVLAESRGQGLVPAKEGDSRPVLDAETISSVKDYVTAWTKKNNFPTPCNADLNDAVTERIHYARKQISKATGKKKL